MNPHFFTAPFYFAFIWFRVQGSRFRAQGSGFKVQGSGFKVQGSRGGFAAFFRRGYSRIVRTNTRICGKRITTDKAFPAWGRWRAERAG